MTDILRRLEHLGRVRPSTRLDERIESLIADAEAEATRHRAGARWVPVAVTLGASGAAVGLALAILLGGGETRVHTPPELTIELPLTPAIERVLRPTPASHQPFLGQYFAEVKTLYIAGVPESPVRLDG